MDLSELRTEIDRTDAALTEAFLRRMTLSEQVAAYKIEHGIPILNREREKTVLDKAAAAAGEQARFAVPLYAVLMALSRTRQAEMCGNNADMARELRQAFADWQAYTAVTASDKRILVLNGPNLNLLGLREPEIYGHETYADLCSLLEAEAEKLSVSVTFFQSNHEGDLVDAIQNARATADGILLNPGAYTHTSIALLDALKAVALPTVEVHISDPDTREPFRRQSYIRAACIAAIKGRGLSGYLDALRLLAEHLRSNTL